jgi:hypothetical protein
MNREFFGDEGIPKFELRASHLLGRHLSLEPFHQPKIETV